MTRRIGQNLEYKYSPLGRNWENSVGDRISDIITFTVRLQRGHIEFFFIHSMMHRLQKV